MASSRTSVRATLRRTQRRWRRRRSTMVRRGRKRAMTGRLTEMRSPMVLLMRRRTKKKDLRRKMKMIFWVMNRLTREKKMLTFMVSRSMKMSWRTTKMKETQRKNSSSRRKPSQRAGRTEKTTSRHKARRMMKGKT